MERQKNKNSIKDKSYSNVKPKSHSKRNHGITLVALVVSIVVMLILAGVSINAVVGDNGIITQAQNATYATSRAVLEEWLNQLYVENYDDFSEYDNKIEGFLSSTTYSAYFYNPATDSNVGSLSYIVDSEGHALYLIKKSALPDDIKGQLAGGDAGDGNYSSYASLIDVYGVTTDLKVYYCSNGTDTIVGITEDELDLDNPNRTVTLSSELATILGTETTTTAQNLRKVRTLTISNTSSISLLGELYNLTSLQELTLKNVTFDNLSGIENCTSLYYVYFQSSTISDYSALAKLGSKLQYLYFYNINDEELQTACSNLSNAEFSSLYYMAIIGYDGTCTIGNYINDTSKMSYSTNSKTSKVITTLSPLEKLSSTTKKAVKYLSICNNNISGDLSSLIEFTSLIYLRCDYNSITSLNGLNNMSNLAYLQASNNAIGSGVANSTDTSLNSLANKTKLYSVYLLNNENLAYVDDFKANTAIRYFYLAGCSKNMNINNIVSIITACGTNYSLPVALLTGRTYIVSDYYDDVSSVTYDELYSDLYNNTYIYSLNLEGVSLTNTQCQTILSSMTNLRAVNLNGITDLSTIEFVKNTPYLITLKIGDTSVTDLTLLNSYATSLGTLEINNADIELTEIQGVISKISTNYDTDTVGGGRGLCINNADLIKTLSDCTEITQLCMYNNSGTTSTTIDLTNCTKLTYVLSRGNGCCIKISNSVQTVSTEDWNVDLTNHQSLKSLTFSWGGTITYAENALSTLSDSQAIEEISVSRSTCTFDLANLSLMKNTSLKKLSITANTSNSIITLANYDSICEMTNLESLILKYCKLSELGSLSNLTKLTYLSLSYSTIPSSLEFIQNNTAITDLYLISCGVTGLKYIENFVNLETLDLRNNSVYATSTYKDENGDDKSYSNVDILVSLNGNALTTLYLAGNTDITSNATYLSELTSLEWTSFTY